MSTPEYIGSEEDPPGSQIPSNSQLHDYGGKLWVTYDGSYRIDRADQRVTIPLEWIEYARAGHVLWARVDGDILTITADREVIYRLGEHVTDELGRAACRAEWPES